MFIITLSVLWVQWSGAGSRHRAGLRPRISGHVPTVPTPCCLRMRSEPVARGITIDTLGNNSWKWRAAASQVATVHVLGEILENGSIFTSLHCGGVPA